MIEVDLGSLLAGLGVGVVASVLFFGGLAWGMVRALRSRRPALWLLASFVLRALLLLGAALAVGRWAAQPLWAWLGFVPAFFGVRALAVRRARSGPPAAEVEAEGAPCS